MRKEWKIKNPFPQTQILAKKYNLNPIMVQLLLNRGIKEEDFFSFLNPNYSLLLSPFLLPDMEKAVKRIKKAVEHKEKIFLFGDYDVDGITSLVIFYEYLKNFASSVSFYIPHRIEEGYGLNIEAIKRMKKEGISLLICFDCGTDAYREIEKAKSEGIDVIVVDHHTPKREDFSPYAFINPKRVDSSYPFKDLSSAALSFKLVWALEEKIPLYLLDLVALSVVCDIVPLKGENRLFLKEGIKWLRSGHRETINILCKIAKIDFHNLTPYHLGYILGPRINASGRISSAKEALNLFLVEDKKEKEKIAYQLEEYNQKRRAIEARIIEEAERMVEDKEDFVYVLYKDGWHPGVLGIVASKFVEKYWRPTFIIGINEMLGRGSARSIPQVNLVEILNPCQEYLIEYGGHKKACGFKIHREYLEEFKEKVNQITKEKLEGNYPSPFWDIDIEVKFKDINLSLLREIEKLEPFGEGNEPPLFLTSKVLPKSLPKKKNSKYSFWLSDGSLTLEAIVSDEQLIDIVNYGSYLDIIYYPQSSSLNQIRLVVKDLRLS
ncbi:MAG: single-stranded-DNA-specific exonuclease RecJ [Candidatus Omnitrophica bacterium 4484_70.1]|nr:MAG: single-stranded-DNA-specific exonuclease RecJ [Candidatus Omnitrophica bacterium 4484_70.1]